MSQVFPRRPPERLPMLPQRPLRMPSPVLPPRPQLSPRAAIPQTFDYRAWLAGRNAPAAPSGFGAGAGGPTGAGVNPSAPVINSAPAFAGSGYAANTSLPESVLSSDAPVMRFDSATGLSGLPTGGLGGGGGMAGGAPMMPASTAALLFGMGAGSMLPPSMPAPPAYAAGGGMAGALVPEVPFDIARAPPIMIGGAFNPDVNRLPPPIPTGQYATAPLAPAAAPPSLPMSPLGLLPPYMLPLPSESGSSPGGSTLGGFAPWMLGGY
jgi:hypothetical protein